ncbi:MAG TPA: OmpA family protein [Gemmatimonadaceae bacterium]|nr:OmpA family protein [Gemmatimonadaceae bacterium]
MSAPSPANGFLRTALWVLSLLVGLGAPVRAQGAADSAEQVIVDFRLGHLDARTVPAYRAGDRALLPLSPLLEMAEIRFTLDTAGRLEAVVHPGAVRLLIDARADARADTMRYGGRRVAAGAGARVFADGELYVESQALGALLGVSFTVRWDDLAVTLEDPSELPVARRIRREAQRAAFLARRDRERAAASGTNFGLERPRLDGLVFDYSLSVPGARPLRDAGYTAALGVDAFGGSLEGSVYGSASGGARGQGSWSGVWRDNPWLRQLRLGDALATGPVARLQRGVALTNSPFVRPARFGTLAFPGALPAGWQLEAYRGGSLVALDSADAGGRFAVALPIDYGDNAVDFVAYGPYGEERTFARSYHVLGELLPARQVEYGLSVGQCTGGVLSGCSTTANLDLRYGLTGRWTARAGVDRFWRDSLVALTHPYASVVGRVNETVALQAERVGGARTSGGVRFEPSLDLRLSADYTRYDRGDKLPLLGPAGWRSRTVLGGFLRPFGTRSLFFFEGSAERIETAVGAITSTRLGTSFQSLGVRYMPYTRVERTTPGAMRSLVGINTYIFPPLSWGTLLSRTLVRAGGEVAQDGRVANASGSLSRQLPRGLQLEAGGLWVRGSRAPSFTLGLSVNRAAVRSYSSVVSSGGAPPSATQFVQGSVLWNRATSELSLTAGPAMQRAGIAGRVYLDENVNGRFDAGEPVIPEVYVRVGQSGALTDSAGVFRVWDVVPYEPVALQVDSLSLPSPLWVPATAAASISLAPNRFLPYEVAIVAGGTVEGRVVQEVGGRRSGVGGVRLTLREVGGADADRGRRPLTTFSDGDFTDMPLRPGEYEAAVDQSVLRQLGATAAPVRFTVRAVPDGDRVTGVELLLVPNAPPPPPPPPAAEVDTTYIIPPPAVGDTLTSLAPPAPRDLGGVDGKGSGTRRGRPAAARVLPTTQTSETRELVATGSSAVTRVLFDANSALLRRESEPVLRALGALMLANSTMHLVIEGHTDSVGPAARNLAFSERRARSVRWYLHTNFGIPWERMTPRGFGEEIPVADNGTAAGRRLNRRVQCVDVGDAPPLDGSRGLDVNIGRPRP